MTAWRIGFVFSCCLLAGVATMSTECFAQSASPLRNEKSSANTNLPEETTARPEQGYTDDFSRRMDDEAMSLPDYNNSLGPHLLRSIGEDQRAIWMSPAHLRLSDADWLLPLGIAAGGMLATDTEFSKHLSNSPSRLKYSRDFSNYGLMALVGSSGGLYLWGRITHGDHKRETGLLAGEAALNSFAMTYATKYAFGRERPLEDNFRGRFGQRGDSFPSLHASASWAIAGVIAHEYPGPLTSVFAYGLASAVSASRVSAKQHFPTDVLAGATMGWFIGQEVYRHHHDPELGGRDWQTYAESREEVSGRESTPRGSPYVELDSWIYPAIERLAALGYIHSDFLGVRPWTRIECARLVEEVTEEIQANTSAPEEAERLYSVLIREFSGDVEEAGNVGRLSVQMESVYTGVTAISGPPLHDSYHFGQTIISDYGRPYEQGFNMYNGFSGYGTAGRFTLYIRGEFQHAPAAPAYSDAVQQAIAVMDQNPVQPALPFASVNQFRLLDSYFAATVGDWDLAFGKQSLWWGPGDGGALLFSDNAEPIYMFRASRIAPLEIPLLSRLLGPAKLDAFVGKLSGNEFPPRPAIHGEKISFRPTQNLEMGFSRTAEFGGVGRPMTLGAILNSYVSFTSSVNYGPSRNPGKRAGGFEFSYRVPLVRNWLTVYADSYSPDDPSPLAGPRRAAALTGLYMPRIPRASKLDFRFEAVYTNTPARDNPPPLSGLYAYWDLHYHDYYTNRGNIIGSWIGRDGQGFQSWTTYHFTPKTSVQFGYRHAKVERNFIPGGETVNDGSVHLSWSVWTSWAFSSWLQYEKWAAPILAPTQQTNWTGSVQVEFWPRSWMR